MNKNSVTKVGLGVAVCLCFTAGGITAWHSYYGNQPQAVVSQADKVVPNVEPPIKAKGLRLITTLPPVKLETNHVNTKIVEDETVSKLWFDLRQKDADVKALREQLQVALANRLSYSTTSSVISAFPYVPYAKDQVGFYEDMIPYPDALVDIVTTIGPQTLQSRASTLVAVTGNNSNSFVTSLADSSLVPNYFATQVSGENKLLVVSNVLSDEMFSTGRGLALSLWDVRSIGVKIEAMPEIPSISKYYTRQGNNLVFKPEVDLFTATSGQGQVNSAVFVEIPKASGSIYYQLEIKDGKLISTKVDQ